MDQEKRFNADIGRSISELQSLVKQFEIRQKLYRTLIRGRGLEFESFRPYSPDEDASTIDWMASTRANKMLVRQYREERNLQFVFVVDVSAGMVLGSLEKLKCEYSAEVIAALAHLIVSSGDKVGFIFFNDTVKQYFPPASGLRNFYSNMDYLTNPAIYSKHSNLSSALEFVSKYVKPSVSSVILVSDFISFDEKSKTILPSVSARFETLALMIKDPLDKTLPNISEEVVIEDPKTGQQILINPQVAKNLYEKNALDQENFFRRACSQKNVDILALSTSKPFAPTLSQFLKGRLSNF
jgi:uncharacterized protein (DUF58 family)